MTHLIQSALTMLRAGEWMPVTAAPRSDRHLFLYFRRDQAVRKGSVRCA
jgi:hypothetical protein